MKFNTAHAVAATVLLIASNAAFAAGELKVSGAAAVAANIIAPNKQAIEKQAELTLAMTVNGDGNGLKDLVSGKTDVAMIAAPIKVTADILNKAAPGSVSIDGIQVAPLGALSIKFIVNPANPVKALSEQQLKDIFTGKVANWKDVGGADQPIMVVAEAPGFGTRSNIEANLLGSELSDKARVMQALAQVAQVVAQAPNAIGYGNAASINSAVTVIPGTEVKQQLGLATKGAPSAEVKRLIEASAKFGAAVK